MLLGFEIHCPNCGVLRRAIAKQPKQCPDCGSKEIVVMNDNETEPRDYSAMKDCAACHRDCSYCEQVYGERVSHAAKS